MKERIIRAVAGTFVLTSAVMTMLVNINWIWLAVFVGANLLQSSMTKFCPLEWMLTKAGVDDGKPSKAAVAAQHA
ncbi:MAG TPA: DUF2892 domain-containing protein [Chitinophagaceae bacterium]